MKWNHDILIIRHKMRTQKKKLAIWFKQLINKQVYGSRINITYLLQLNSEYSARLVTMGTANEIIVTYECIIIWMRNFYNPTDCAVSVVMLYRECSDNQSNIYIEISLEMIIICSPCSTLGKRSQNGNPQCIIRNIFPMFSIKSK